ncbi:MAG TPA: amylo-alpha-1,6-glucosidase [Xanthobacteraceae bacterium]|nr:amylo-alpha-1,6-glucosidase [Xanthobacteraceae bacterium]
MPIDSAARAVPAEEVHETPFYIPVTGPASRLRRTLKCDDTFLVLDSHGDIGVSVGGSDGLFDHDTRFLSRLELSLNERPLLLLGDTLRDDNTLFTVHLTNPDIYAGQRIVLSKDTVHIVRTFFLWQGTAYQRLGIRNFGDRSVQLVLGIAFDSDFADLFEVRGMHRERRGIATRKVAGLDRVLLHYDGLDRKTRRTMLTFDPPPTKLAPNMASYRFKLAPGEAEPIFLAVGCDRDEAAPMPFLRGLLNSRRAHKAATRNGTTVETSNDVLNEILCRSAADLAMLMTQTPQGRYPYAGTPWYSTTFGRDGLITALQMLWWNPDIAQGVLRRLAAYQATSFDPLSDAEPGKILHEMRGGEMAALREVPFGLYYGSVDATPLFVLLAGLHAERTGDDGTIAELWPAIQAALGWIDGPADPDRDGFVEYRRASEQGLVNQGWKDSYDAIFHADGRLAEGPIALAEVQGYVYAAKRVAARCASRLGRMDEARKLDSDAAALAEKFEAAFWCPEIGTFALALDGAKKPCRVRSSNAGQVLFTGIASAERAATVARGLMENRFFSGWGIRTIAKGEARFNPMSYHNGSIWPHDNALIALGFARYGLTQAVAQLFKALFDAASYMDLRRLPELFCGFPRQHGQGPTVYPVACSPQAWASATPFTLLEASLGLEFDPLNNEIRLRNPALPSFVDEVTLRNLRLGAASADITIRRYKDATSLDILRTTGQVQISIVLCS